MGEMYDWRTFDPAALTVYSAQYRSDSPAHEEQKGIYVYNSFQVYGPVRLILGGRYADYENVSSTYRVGREPTTTIRRDTGIFTPYYALVYDFAEHWSAYVTTAESYEDQSNLYTDAGTSLDPTEGRSFELGIKGAHWEGRLNSAVTLYRSKRENFGVRVSEDETFDQPGRSCCYAGNGEFLSQGVEVDLGGELMPGWQINAGYTYDDNQTEYGDSKGKRYASYTPKHIFRAWTRYNLSGALSQWTVGGGVSAQSSFFRSGTVRTWDPEGGTDGLGGWTGDSIPFEFTVPGRAIWNGFVEYQLHPNWRTVINVSNAFDKTYFQRALSSSTYGEPRNVLLTLRGTFH